MRKNYLGFVAMILALCLVMTGYGAVSAFAESAPAEEVSAEGSSEKSAGEFGFEKGMKMQDFSFTTFDGKTMSLYEVLEEKDMVLLNFWASWCGPCEMEFPYMEQAYQVYKDDVEIFALSMEPTDSDEVLADYVERMGMSFPVGRDEHSFYINEYSAMGYNGVPTSVVVDRFGTICFAETGSMPSFSDFRALFSAFIGDDYTESVVYDSLPTLKSDAEPLSAEELAAVLNVEGAALAFENGEGENQWPFIREEVDGRSVLRSSNIGVDSSSCTVNFTVSAKAGDAIVIDFKTSSQAANDMLLIEVNDEFAKAFGGEHDWMQYAHSFGEAGEYNVSLSYVKDYTESDGEDCVWIDSVALVSGTEAEAAVGANPVYPVADEFSITIVSEDARKLVFNDPAGILDPGPEFECYNSESGEIKFLIQLPAEIDSETVYLFDYFNGYQALIDNMTEEGYLITCKTGDLLDKYQYPFTLVGCESLYFELPRNVFLLFVSGDQLDAHIKESVSDSNGNAFLKWAYADEVDVEKFYAEKIEADFSELVDGDAQYNIFVQDQNGEPVPGVMLQVCDEASCMVYTSDESGSCSFSLPVKTYELHVLVVPEGFDSDDAVYELPVVGGDMLITLNKN